MRGRKHGFQSGNIGKIENFLEENHIVTLENKGFMRELNKNFERSCPLDAKPNYVILLHGKLLELYGNKGFGGAVCNLHLPNT